MKNLSVVVASQDCAATIGDCMTSLRRQRTDDSVEIIVVDNSSDGSAQIVERHLPGTELIKVSGPALVPELWARGALRATGQVVAFTTGDCVPHEDWLSEILRYHESGYAGIGGAIENMQPSSMLQWATYFARFTPFMSPFPERPADQIPGDNASYKRFVLDECAEVIKHGFWETDVNNRLRAGGHSLLLAPRIVVYHAYRGGAWAFCRRRIQHGRVFGAARTSGRPPFLRFVYLALAPLVPAVLLAKIVRRVCRPGGRRRELLLALPWLVLFVLAWSWGELLGYLSAWSRARGLARGVASSGGTTARGL